LGSFVGSPVKAKRRGVIARSHRLNRKNLFILTVKVLLV